MEIIGKYILGSKVMRLTAKIEDKYGRSTTVTPPFELCLQYSDEIRKKAYELVREEGAGLSAALMLAVKCTETRELHFSTPFGRHLLTLRDVVKSPAVPAHSAWTHPWLLPPSSQNSTWQPTGKGKGSGKPPVINSFAKPDAGKGKGGKGKIQGEPQHSPGSDGLFSRTKKGEEICFKFNGAAGCTGGCMRHHICRKCRATGHAVGSNKCNK